jgi:inorganic phosphate transporter, PiT family
MAEYSMGLLFVLFLVLVSEFINGWTDAPNAIATVIATRVLKPKWALILAPMGNIVGAFIGTEVAKTIGTEFVKAEAISLVTLGAAMIGIISWGIFSWYFGLPISKSHAMVAGLAGAALATAGPSVLLWKGWEKVLIGLGFSSILGFGLGWLFAWSIRHGFRRAGRPKATKAFSILQIFSATGMALSHGSNDGQKFIGIFTLALVLGGVSPVFHVQQSTIIICSLVMGIGTSIGGWRIIKTMGEKMVHLEPYQGFAAETAGTGAILLASHLGIPLSTTHTINTSIMGVGAATRLSGIRWGVVREIVTTWIMTFPICFGIGYLIATVAKVIIH